MTTKHLRELMEHLRVYDEDTVDADCIQKVLDVISAAREVVRFDRDPMAYTGQIGGSLDDLGAKLAALDEGGGV